MPYLPIYIEQSQTTRGLYKPLRAPGTKAEAQAALDAEVASNGDSDPSHYRVIEVVAVNTPNAKQGGFVV